MAEKLAVWSYTYDPCPSDLRCKYWCKVVRHGVDLPMPEIVKGARDLPGSYLNTHEEIELFDSDLVFEGEAKHHRKMRGFDYNLGVIHNQKLVWVDHHVKVKQLLRAAGERELLLGSGEVAMMVRWANAYRKGVVVI